jgi:branched-chain amino acid transport system ATP-binding protein
MEAILETKRLTRFFGGLSAVSDLDLELSKDRVTSIIGPNGAGKTTLFNLITGRLSPSSGKIFFKGHDITHLPTHEILLRGIARSFQVTNVFQGLTVYENIRISCQSKVAGLNLFSKTSHLSEVNQRALDLLKTLGLLERRDELAGNLSHGEQRILEVGMALATKPELLLLDEPTAGLSPEETSAFAQFVKEISRELTVVLIEHDMDVVMKISDWVVVMHQGRKLMEGTPQQVKENEEVNLVYFGE